MQIISKFHNNCTNYANKKSLKFGSNRNELHDPAEYLIEILESTGLKQQKAVELAKDKIAEIIKTDDKAYEDAVNLATIATCYALATNQKYEAVKDSKQVKQLNKVITLCMYTTGETLKEASKQVIRYFVKFKLQDDTDEDAVKHACRLAVKICNPSNHCGNEYI